MQDCVCTLGTVVIISGTKASSGKHHTSSRVRIPIRGNLNLKLSKKNFSFLSSDLLLLKLHVPLYTATKPIKTMHHSTTSLLFPVTLNMFKYVIHVYVTLIMSYFYPVAPFILFSILYFSNPVLQQRGISTMTQILWSGISLLMTNNHVSTFANSLQRLPSQLNLGCPLFTLRRQMILCKKTVWRVLSIFKVSGIH